MQSRSPRDLFLILVFINFCKIFIRVDSQQVEAVEILGKRQIIECFLKKGDLLVILLKRIQQVLEISAYVFAADLRKGPDHSAEDLVILLFPQHLEQNGARRLEREFASCLYG